MTVVLAHSPAPSAHAAFASALEQARMSGTDLVLLNVSSNDALADPKHASDDVLAGYLAEGEQAGVATRIERVVASDAAEAVLETARRLDARLVVVGVRHRSSVGKLLMGSTAQRILLAAECDVLAVKVKR
ncbi:universal stress protein [Nocardioides zeae]|uniref:Universal stress protein n=1 Tax=Nocardioides imazamoxiresistens TaxID=3231893 RepID=A0ABU3PRZ6_9ACTN|nr:universal stress protein [Nocardioides zeae]MDT9591555.1 universal stress protein [Nocardioides zeae]